jgi:hypothetical protein
MVLFLSGLQGCVAHGDTGSSGQHGYRRQRFSLSSGQKCSSQNGLHFDYFPVFAVFLIFSKYVCVCAMTGRLIHVVSYECIKRIKNWISQINTQSNIIVEEKGEN